MKPAHLEVAGLTLLALGTGSLIAAAWLLAGVVAALVAGGIALVLAGMAAVKTAALTERNQT